MKKVTIIVALLVLILLMLTGISLAVEQKNTMETETSNELIEMKDKTKNEMDDYNRKYGEGYGTTAYILNKVRIFSIPLCFIGIAVGALYQYVLGTRRLDMKHRGFGLIVAFITILVICQILPLIYAIVVRGWGD